MGPTFQFNFDFDQKGLFKNLFFKFSAGNELPCSTSNEGLLTDREIDQVISYYETLVPNLRENSVKYFFLQHQNKNIIQKIQTYWQICNGRSLCVFEKYWGGSNKISLRALALFYDTRTILLRSNESAHEAFTISQVGAIEKTIRKIPIHIRQKIAYGRFGYGVVMPNHRQPLTFAAMKTKNSFGRAVVIAGSNLVSVADSIDDAADGKAYKNINLKYLVDFRLQMLIHEVGHVVNHHLIWNYETDPKNWSFDHFFNLQNKNILDSHVPVLWVNRFFEGQEIPGVIENGRYIKHSGEKFAEFFAQYILMPQTLKDQNPQIYNLLYAKVFNGVQYQGYESCSKPTVKELSWIEKLTALTLK